jgi:hypothetical protein
VVLVVGPWLASSRCHFGELINADAEIVQINFTPGLVIGGACLEKICSLSQKADRVG